MAGPFDNPAGNAFHTDLPPERAQRIDDRFAGRSGLPVRWVSWQAAGRVLDVEPLFSSGPGVVVLWARLKLPPAKRYRLVAAGSPGVVVRIDGRKLVQYLDTHVPVPRDQAPYAAEFEAGEETVVMVKLIRDLKPASPFALYFLDEDGVVDPVAWLSMPE